MGILKLHHITTKEIANKIMTEGFKLNVNKYKQISGNGVYMTTKDSMEYWKQILQNEHFQSELCTIECEVSENIKILNFEFNTLSQEKSIDLEEFNDWVKENRTSIIEESKEVSDDEKTGYAMRKYAIENNFNCINITKYHKDFNTDERIIESVEYVIYSDIDNVKPVSIINN